MYDHIGLRVANLDAAVRFYSALLAPLGYELCTRGDGYAGFGPPGAPALWLHAASTSPGSGAHVAFRARDHSAVDQFHRQGLAAGARDNGAPGMRADYSPTYYAAFLIDLDGNNVEAVCVR
jgi:catechol 2,3-dioxygenase-like lactoylglutathione lyase family enzyme